MRLLRLSRFLVAGLAIAGLLAAVEPRTLRAQEDKTKEKKTEEMDKAEKAFAAGKFDDSLKALQDAEKKDPKLPPARLMFARFCLAAAQGAQKQEERGQLFQMAQGSIERSAIEAPSHPEIFLQLGSIALAQERLAETVLDCQFALQLAKDPKWTAEQKKNFEREGNAGLATAFEKRGDWENTKTYLTAWKTIEPKSAPVMQRLARALFALNNPDGAFAELNAAGIEDKTMDPSEVIMAQLWANKPDKAKAEEWFQKAIAKNPKLAKVHQSYGGWLLDTGNIPAAKVSIDQAKAIDPNSPETQSLLGLLARYEGKLDLAEKIFDELSRQQPANFFASNQLAQVLAEQTGSPAQQQRALQIAQVNKDRLQRNAEAWATLGWVAFLIGKEAEAEQALNVAISSGQLSPDTAYFVARLMEKKDPKGNADTYRRFLEGAVGSQSAFIHRAAAQKMLDDVNKAYPKKEEKKDVDPKGTTEKK